MYGLADISKNGHSGRVVPVVNHLLQNVSIRARWRRFKEVAPNRFAPLRKPFSRDRAACALYNARQIKHYPLRAGIPAQDRREQPSVASPDIDNLSEASEIVCPNDAGRVSSRYLRHAGVKDLLLFGMFGH